MHAQRKIPDMGTDGENRRIIFAFGLDTLFDRKQEALLTTSLHVRLFIS